MTIGITRDLASVLEIALLSGVARFWSFSTQSTDSVEKLGG
jgi:hypothetical protein